MLSRWQMRARVLVVFGMAAVALPARADEPADRGISMSAWAGAAVDRSVVAADSGRPASRRRAADRRHRARQHQVGRAGRHRRCHSRNQRRWTAVDRRLAGCSARGRQDPHSGSGRGRPPPFLGRGRYRFAHQIGPDTWLPYLGVRLGVARTVPAHGMFEVGAWLFGRYDVGEATVTNVGSFHGRGEPDRLPAGRLDVRAGASGSGCASRPRTRAARKR